jgi:putative acetyltransferase
MGRITRRSDYRQPITPASGKGSEIQRIRLEKIKDFGVKATMDLLIRPVRLSDSEDINEMRRQEGVRANTLALATETVAFSEVFLRNMGSDDHVLVAELDGKVIGMVGIHLLKSARQRHIACLGMMVRTEYQGRGIGKKLLENILDLADNWLMLVRVELEVTPDNERAICLYNSFGFEVEGRKKYSIIKGGKYADLIIMARYNIPSQFK